LDTAGGFADIHVIEVCSISGGRHVDGYFGGELVTLPVCMLEEWSLFTIMSISMFCLWSFREVKSSWPVVSLQMLWCGWGSVQLLSIKS